MDVRLAQLLTSKLCHDLIGPAGAINTGLELIAEEGLDADSLDLVTTSGTLLTTRLGFYRVAFGLSGSHGAEMGEMGLNDIRALAQKYFETSKAHLDWAPGSHEPPALALPTAKVLLLMLLLAADGMPRGGVISVHTAALPEGSGIVVTGTGTGVRLREDLMAALADGASLDDMSARNVHAFYAQMVALNAGGRIEGSLGEDGDIRFMVLFPATG